MDRDPLSAVCFALSSPVRRAILERLARGEATVQELGEPFEMTLPAISKHLAVLRDAGLVAQRGDRQRRPCRLTGDGLENLTAWLLQHQEPDPGRGLAE